MDFPILRVAEGHLDPIVMLVRKLINHAGRRCVLHAHAGRQTAAFHPDVAENAATTVADDQVGCGLSASPASDPTTAATAPAATTAEGDVIQHGFFAGLPEYVGRSRYRAEAEAADDGRPTLGRDNRTERGSRAEQTDQD